MPDHQVIRTVKRNYHRAVPVGVIGNLDGWVIEYGAVG